MSPSKFSELDSYEIRHLVFHLIHCNRLGIARKLMHDCEWLHAKIRVAGSEALIHDCGLLANEPSATTLSRVVRQCAHILDTDASQLFGQVMGRMDAKRNPEMRELLQSIALRNIQGALLPENATLSGPEDMFVRTILAPIDVDGSKIATAIAISRDCRLAASGTHRGIVVWRLEDNSVLFRLHCGNRVDGLRLSVDGTRLCSEEVGGISRFWNLCTGSEIWAGDYWHFPLVFVGGGHRGILKNGGDLELWDLDSFRRVATLPREERSDQRLESLAVATTEDGENAFCWDESGSVYCWELCTGRLQSRIRVGRPVTTFCNIAVIPRTTQLVLVGSGRRRNANDKTDDGGLILLLDWREQLVLSEWSHSRSNPPRAVSHPHRSLIAIGYYLDPSQPIELHCLKSRRAVYFLPSCKTSEIRISPDGKYLFHGNNDDRAVRVVRLPTSFDPGVASHVMSNSNDRFSGTDIHSWSPNVSNDIRNIDFGRGSDHVLAVSPDGKLALISRQFSYELILWDKINGRKILDHKDYSGERHMAIFSRDGRTVVYTNTDGKHWRSPPSMTIWDLEKDTKETLHTSLPPGSFAEISITPDLTYALLGSETAVCAWDLSAKTELWHRAEGHADRVLSLSVTPDGVRAVSGAKDHWIKLWDLRSGELLSRFAIDASVVKCMISDDGEYIFASDETDRQHCFRFRGPGSANTR